MEDASTAEVVEVLDAASELLVVASAALVVELSAALVVELSETLDAVEDAAASVYKLAISRLTSYLTK